MNDLGVTLIWCAVQVTAVGLLAGVLFRWSRYFAPSAAPLISVTSVTVVIGLSGASLGTWPSYFDYLPDTDLAALFDSSVDVEAPVTPRTAGLPRPASAVVADVWRTLSNEASRAQSTAVFGAWHWPSVMGLLFFMGAGLGLLQLAFGLLAVQTHRQRSLPLRDRRLLRLLKQLRDELGCRREVEVRVSYHLSTAATVGWLRPLILLPASWCEWTEQERQAVLAHELAHIRHNDYLAVILSQFGVALHFYHPVMHWLSGRLRLEQELAADAAAAEVAGGRQVYLTTLATMALRQEDGPLSWPARAFLPMTGAFLRRIEALRYNKPPKKLSSGVQFLTLSILLFSGLLLSGLRNPQADAALTRVARVNGAGTWSGQPMIDLSYVGNDASGLLAITPAVLCRYPDLQPITRLTAASDAWRVGAPPEQIEQISWVLYPPTAEQSQWTADKLVIVRSSKPQKYATLIGRLAPAEIVKSWKGSAYFFSERTGMAYFRPQPGTIVLGPERRLRAVLAGHCGEPKFAAHGGWSELTRSHLVVALQSPSEEPRRETPENGPRVLWNETDLVLHGLRFGKTIEGRLFAECRDDVVARRFSYEPYAAPALANSAAKAVEQVGYDWTPTLGVMPTLQAVGDQVLSGSRVERQGKQISVRAETGWWLVNAMSRRPNGGYLRQRDTSVLSYEEKFRAAMESRQRDRSEQQQRAPEGKQRNK